MEKSFLSVRVIHLQTHLTDTDEVWNGVSAFNVVGNV